MNTFWKLVGYTLTFGALFLGFFWLAYIIEAIQKQELTYIPFFGTAMVVIFYQSYDVFKSLNKNK